MKLVITCEHGGNKIPRQYRWLFSQSQEVLATHAGFDIGALKLARAFAKHYADYFFYAEVSRLVVELNRSLHHRCLFSSFTQKLTQEEKDILLNQFYFPYRTQVQQAIAEEIKQGEVVLHLSVHSFTPYFKGIVRFVDIGLLYDPKREGERLLCKAWKQEVGLIRSDVKLAFNAPYRGIADGFVTYLRKHFPGDQYVGIELEVNQRILVSSSAYKNIKRLLLTSFGRVVHI